MLYSKYLKKRRDVSVNFILYNKVIKKQALSLSLSSRLKRPRQVGFTIVELLIVIVVIAILAAVTVVAFRGISDRARASSMQSDLSQAAKQLELAKVDNSGSYPSTLSSNIKASSGTTLTYNPSGNTYCLTATNSGSAYRVTNTNTKPAEGSCSGVLGDGSSCPSGFIVVPGNGNFGTSDFCVMKYQAKNAGGTAVSQASGTPWVSISQTNAIATASSACDGCHLVTEAEWMTLAANVLSVNSNWSGGSVGSGYIYSGHNDNNPANSLAASSDDDGYSGTGNSSGNQRRTLTLTNGEVIWDMAGNVYEWTNATIAGGQQPGLSGESAYAWKQWNNGSLQVSGLPSSSQPSSAGAGSWSSTQGIGQLYSNSGEAGLRAFRRGGDWYGSSNAGVLTLNLSSAPSYTNMTIGFRVAR